MLFKKMSASFMIISYILFTFDQTSKHHKHEKRFIPKKKPCKVELRRREWMNISKSRRFPRL